MPIVDGKFQAKYNFVEEASSSVSPKLRKISGKRVQDQFLDIKDLSGQFLLKNGQNKMQGDLPFKNNLTINNIDLEGSNIVYKISPNANLDKEYDVFFNSKIFGIGNEVHLEKDGFNVCVLQSLFSPSEVQTGIPPTVNLSWVYNSSGNTPVRIVVSEGVAFYQYWHEGERAITVFGRINNNTGGLLVQYHLTTPKATYQNNKLNYSLNDFEILNPGWTVVSKQGLESLYGDLVYIGDTVSRNYFFKDFYFDDLK